MYGRNFYEIVPEVINGEIGNISYNVYCPVILQPENNACRTINNFSRHECGEFLKYIQDELGGCNQRSEVARCYQLMYQSAFILSLKYEMNVPDNKGKLFTFISGAVWNTREGRRVELKEFFRGNVRFREIILYIISGKIKSKIAAGEKFHSDWHSRLYAASKKMGYYVCKEGFVFLFPSDTFKAGENKNVEILVGFMDLKNQLSSRLL